jgi:hypothetical protein
MRHVLWIEDEATFDLNRLAAAVNVTFRYKLTIAKTVTDALRHLNNGVVYEAIIVDMRLLPGDDPRWARLGEHSDHALLGKELILALLRSPKGKVQLAEEEIPKWIGVERFAVFTVEPEKELTRFLSDIGIDRRCYQRKKASLEQTTLLDLIETVIRYSHGRGPNGHHQN